MNLTRKISKILFAAVALVFVQYNLNAQSVLFDHEGFFNSILDQKNKLNSYYIGNNPAYLDYELSDERLLSELSFENRHGDFKSFIMPKDQSDFQISFTGKKKVSEHGVFKGSAGFNKEIRNNWNWVFNKYYERSNPFLYGDSTTGTSRFNSIVMNAQYKSRLMDNLNFGFSFDYAVDEGLKKVSPKPESKHRDLMLNLGLAYDISQNTSIGLAVKYQDYTEQINYEEDEGAIYDETVIIKFTGYDFPSIYYKKTEDRRTYTNVYFATLNYQYQSESFIVTAAFSGGFDGQTIKDGGTDPIPKGYSKNNYWQGDFVALYKLTSSFIASIKYQYRYTDYWAKHPDYDVLIMEEQTPSHFINLGFEYALNEALSLGLEGGIRYHNYDMNDYYSDITAGYDGKEYLVKIGADYIWCNVFSTTFGIAYNKNELTDRVLDYEDAGKFFEEFRKYDLLYKLTPYTSFAGYLKTSVDIKGVGEFCLNIIYSQTNPEDEAVFEDFNQKNINAWLQFRKKVY